MKAIVILTDTLRRDFLSTYSNTDVKTPNLERLQKKSVVFDQHWAGSLPCMPARRDMMTGRLNFLERNWGPIEPFDETLPETLNENGIFSHIVTDHYHYFEKGGENYCQSFNTWDLIRGQEHDPWVSKVNDPELPEYIGRYPKQYHLNRSRFVEEKDFTSPKTIQSAIQWLDNNKDADDYLLWVEMFDPHEPFDLPSEYLDLYDDEYDGPLYMWPKYRKNASSEKDLAHVRNRYSGLVTMMDKWIGKLLDKMDEQNMWEDTMLIFTTDHGTLLDEHEFMGKNFMPLYNEISHLPLMVHMPGGKNAGTRTDALTQNIDIMPTILDFFGVHPSESNMQGKSWLPLLEKQESKRRNYAIYGCFGKNVNITDGEFTYFRAAINENNSPLNLYTSMPTTLTHYYNDEYIKDFKDIEMGRFLKWTDYPVYKIPGYTISLTDESLGFTHRGEFIGENLLFNIQLDYSQERPIKDPNTEKKYVDLLAAALIEYDAPDEQFERLGLKNPSVPIDSELYRKNVKN
ncbi:sulfatase [Alteribacillus sp. YIM 98480]|uniref:sulfatase n=1 Tax=Alteribacillus sp. YIM 98480 TaxID=2606599 RepID=UPI00131B0C75|nr:sulfatase [Alteribacillus sp. YIM 98480]